MAIQLFANNASALLAGSITDTDLAVQVATGFGALFPNPGVGEYFLITLTDAAGNREICRVTARATDIMTVLRAQEGTIAQSWTGGLTRVELRLTKGSMEVFLQKGGGTMSGDIDMDGNDVIDANLSGSGTRMVAGQIAGVPVRGAIDLTVNQILVPNDGSRATAGGVPLLVNTDDVSNNVFKTGMIMLWYGSAANVPAGWAICDGTNGTPDMRDRFPIGVSGTRALGTTGGAEAASGTIGSSGAHTHGGVTGETILTDAQLPAHNHRLFVDTTADTDSVTVGFGHSSGVAVAGKTPNIGGYIDQNIGGTQLVEDAGTGVDGHDHTISSDGAHTHSLSSIATVPPYRALYFIMRL
jgi:microcystin-dependent protein